MSGSQQTMALLEAFHAEDHHHSQGSQSELTPVIPYIARPRPHGRRHHLAGPNLDPPRLICSTTSPKKTKSFSLIPVARDKPLSNYPTAFRWTAPITRPEHDNQESLRDACPLDDDDDKVHSGIGNLGQRRGFKGKPLTVSNWSRSSLFLSLPRGLNFSPRSSSITSLDGAFPSSPRTPLEAVANRMRSVSVSVVSWSSGVKTPVLEVSQDLQDLYDASDPFASHGDTFFAFMTDVSTVPTPDLCQLGLYKQHGMTRKQSCIVKKKKKKRNTLPQAALHQAFTNARMKTTIYDMSTADVVPARVTISVARNISLDVPKRGPDVVDGIVAVASPTIVLTAPPSPTIQEVDKDKTNLANEPPVLDDTHEFLGKTREPGSEEENENKAPRSALAEFRNTPFEQNQQDISELTTQPTPVLSAASDCLGDDGLANVQFPTFPYAEFPKVVYETCGPCNDDALVPFPGVADIPTPCSPISVPRSYLRPLVLPARVASRLSTRIAPVPEDNTGRSQALEGIIALLDVGFTTQEV
ncbi:hypothetical protein C0995_015996 [Termitomyces sp. Mi166|nr:hypothetical protein C0995_015996 [Termitomyces sp. Mi166\